MSERRLLIGLAVVCLLVAVGAVGYGAGKASDVPEVIRAQRFEVVDGQGRTRAILDTSSAQDGAPWLSLFDAKGTMRGCFYLSNGDPVLTFQDGERATRLGLFLSPEGPSLNLWDDKRKGRARLVVQKEGPCLVLLDATGRDRALLGTTRLRSTRSGKVEDRSESSLVLFNSDGMVLWEAPSTPAGVGPRAPNPTTGAAGSYAGIGSGHWVKKVIERGRFVTLEDGSLWEIGPLDRIETVLWLRVSNITVLDGDNPAYPYRLVNTDDGEVAEAKLLSK